MGLALILSGCRSATPTATPTPTRRPATPTATSAPPTPTEEAATAEPTPGAQSEGTTSIPLTGGFDLDAGTDPGRMDPSLDFVLRPAGEGLVEVFPYAGAKFAFTKTFNAIPTQEDCADASITSAMRHSKHVVTMLDTSHYVCYLTGGNHYGYLNFTNMSEDNLSFSWHTFASGGPVFPPFGSRQEHYAWQIDKFVPYESYVDLDEGVEVPSEDTAGDFTVTPGEKPTTVTFTPVGGATFAFDSTYPTEPAPETCAGLDEAKMLDEPRELALRETYNVCYRTGEGRYGYVRLTALDEAGVTLDLKTFDVGAETAGGDEPAGPAACEGGELWFDVWPVDVACDANSEAWSVTIFVEGHGGDCRYTYAWEGEVQGGPMAGSMSFEVQSGGGNIIGTASVSSAGQTVEAPVYVERTSACP